MCLFLHKLQIFKNSHICFRILQFIPLVYEKERLLVSQVLYEHIWKACSCVERDVMCCLWLAYRVTSYRNGISILSGRLTFLCLAHIGDQSALFDTSFITMANQHWNRNIWDWDQLICIFIVLLFPIVSMRVQNTLLMCS